MTPKTKAILVSRIGTPLYFSFDSAKTPIVIRGARRSRRAAARGNEPFPLRWATAAEHHRRVYESYTNPTLGRRKTMKRILITLSVGVVIGLVLGTMLGRKLQPSEEQVVDHISHMSFPEPVSYTHLKLPKNREV